MNIVTLNMVHHSTTGSPNYFKQLSFLMCINMYYVPIKSYYIGDVTALNLKNVVQYWYRYSEMYVKLYHTMKIIT